MFFFADVLRNSQALPSHPRQLPEPKTDTTVESIKVKCDTALRRQRDIIYIGLDTYV